MPRSRNTLSAALIWGILAFQIAANVPPSSIYDDYILGPAIEVPQKTSDRRKRQSETVGTWSLRALSCPEDTQDCGDSAVKACCTKNTVCVSHLFKVACCPSDERCDTTAETLPSCADPAWSLWRNEDRDGYFCCLPGQKGYRTSSKLGACGDEDIVLQSSQILSSATPYNANGNEDPNGPRQTASTTGNIGLDNEPTNISEADGKQGGSDETQNTSSGGLSTGVIAGIAAGGVVLLIAFVLGIWYASRAGARKGAAAATAAIYAQQQQHQSQIAHHPPSTEHGFTGANSMHLSDPAFGTTNYPHNQVKPAHSGVVGVRSIQTATPPSQWAHEADGHQLGVGPKGYSEMESR